MTRRDRGSASGPLLAAFLIVFTIFTVVMLLSKDNQWRPPVVSEHGHGVDRMITYIIFAAGTIFILGHLVLAKFIFSYGKKDGAPYKPPSHKTEMMFTFGPVVLMVAVSEIGVLVIGSPVWHEVYTKQPGDMEVEIVAKQFEWIPHYAGKDGKFGRHEAKFFDDVDNPAGLDPKDRDGKDDILSRGLLALPAGKPVWFNIRSWDVLHSFNIPVFRSKQDAVPGIYTHTRVIPTTPGEYEIACAEICNFGHYKMKAAVRVLTPEDFEKWLSAQSKFGD